MIPAEPKRARRPPWSVCAFFATKFFDKAAALGVGAVCFEGNIAFYGKCECGEASRFGIRYAGLPEGAEASFFLCRKLAESYLDGAAGEYATPAVYFVKEADVEAFDAAFPPKEKLKLPRQ